MADEKPKGMHRFKSQFSMGQLDFERYHKIMEKVDYYGEMVNSGDRNSLVPYFANMKMFYKNTRYLIRDRATVDKMIAEIQRLLAIYQSTKNKVEKDQVYKKLFEKLDEFSDKIYMLKQLSGLGIEVKRAISAKKKFERAMRIE